MLLNCAGALVAIMTSTSAPPALSTAPYPEGVTDESAYGAWLDTQGAALASVGEPQENTELARHLGYRANWNMAYMCEPFVSRALLGTAQSGDAKRLAEHAARARADLERAAALPDLPLELQDDLEFLSGINRAMLHVSAALAGELKPDAVVETTTDLAIWLDDERHIVADSARLWQGLLFRSTGQYDRALRSLPVAVETLSDSRSAFFARTLRCLVHADRGQYSLALAMLLKMEDRCAQWFDDTRDAASAELALLWLRVQVTESDERALRELPRKVKGSRLDRTREYLDEDKDSGLLRLHPAVPLLIESAAAPASPPPGPPAEEPRVVEEPD